MKKPTVKAIERQQKQIARALQLTVHPDNEVARVMNAQYRYLENLKLEL